MRGVFCSVVASRRQPNLNIPDIWYRGGGFNHDTFVLLYARGEICPALCQKAGAFILWGSVSGWCSQRGKSIVAKPITTPWAIPISIVFCVYNWLWRLCVEWKMSGQLVLETVYGLGRFRQLRSAIVHQLNCPNNRFRRLSNNLNCSDKGFRRPFISWNFVSIRFRVLSVSSAVLLVGIV